MALLQLVTLACCAALVSSDIAPSGWIHYRPQATLPHAISINTYRANLPAYYLLPPPLPLPVQPLPLAASAVPLPPLVPLPPAGPLIG